MCAKEKMAGIFSFTRNYLGTLFTEIHPLRKRGTSYHKRAIYFSPIVLLTVLFFQSRSSSSLSSIGRLSGLNTIQER